MEDWWCVSEFFRSFFMSNLVWLWKQTHGDDLGDPHPWSEVKNNLHLIMEIISEGVLFLRTSLEVPAIEKDISGIEW